MRNSKVFFEKNKARKRKSIAYKSLNKNQRYFVPKQNMKYVFAWEQ